MDVFNNLLQKEKKLGFPLYVTSREITRIYKPFLDKYDLTYTQYLTMVTLFDIDVVNVKALGKMLYLDSGTLTPLLIKLEKKGYLTRTRLAGDNRYLNISLTEKGRALMPELETINDEVMNLISTTEEEMTVLNSLMEKMLKIKE